MYYIGTGNVVTKINNTGGSWSSAVPLTLIPKVQGNLTIDQSNGLLFYKDLSNNLIKYYGTNSTIIASQVGGKSFALYNGKVFYFNNSSGNNVVNYTDYAGSYHTAIAGTASQNSSLDLDNSGNVYYADWNSIYYVKNNGSSYSGVSFPENGPIKIREIVKII